MARETPIQRYRNIGISAHIDAGKTTVTEGVLYNTGMIHKIGAVHEGETTTDWMEQERERGITIKSHAIQMDFARGGKKYVLNLIDTPGHVDFSYEVSRALAACEGALLVVDATQGVEAQTLANATLAQNLDLALVPVINKVDLPAADVDGVSEQIYDVLTITADPVHRPRGDPPY